MAVLSLGCNIGLCHEIGCGTCPRPPTNAGGDRFLGGGMFLSVPLRYRLDAVRGLKILDPLTQLGRTRPCIFAWIEGRAGKAGLELVAQRGQFGQVGVVREGLAQAGLVVAKLRFRDSEISPDAVAFWGRSQPASRSSALTTARGPW